MNDIKVNDDDVRLDRYIRKLFPNIKQSVIEKSLRNGLIKINGNRVKSSYRINCGEILTVGCFNQVENIRKPVNKTNTRRLVKILRKNILYEDEYILAINKPIGMIVQGGKINISDVLDQIKSKEMFKIVHRLDRDTSGVIVFARNAKVAQFLMEEFRERRVKKTYLALTSGTPNKDNGVIDYPLVKKYISGQEKVIVDETSTQTAITYFSILKKLKHNIAYLKLQPITGRTHQLRVHLNHINCSILGDGKYGGRKAFVSGVTNRMHLHSHSLLLHLPNGQDVTITAPISEHMMQSIRFLS
ncbi:MAG: RluA family pseudouridine synthase [Wolbachia endosymbiont of Fragariocoptes setiger]|nr:RluA family pseudouridine synthase [Wolbachia endosymbiont of Fragariocoptes setiger]